MTHTYKIDLKHTIKSYSGLLAAAIFIVFSVLLLFFQPITNKAFLNESKSDYIIILISIILTAYIIPPIILHINYFLYSKIKVTINSDKKSITIDKNKQTFEYNYSDIISAEKYSAEMNTSVESNNKKSDKTFFLTSHYYRVWHHFGYIKLEFNDGMTFYITSLMLNPNTFSKKNDIAIENVFRHYPLI